MGAWFCGRYVTNEDVQVLQNALRSTLSELGISDRLVINWPFKPARTLLVKEKIQRRLYYTKLGMKINSNMFQKETKNIIK